MRWRRLNLTMLDVERTLKVGRITEAAEEKNGRWRYRLHGPTAGVVVTFGEGDVLEVVTVWKEAPR